MAEKSRRRPCCCEDCIMSTKKNIVKNLTQFKKDLNKKISVSKIIFFGSHATGKPKKDSDVDLLIVSKDFKQKNFRERPLGFYQYWNLNYPVDFLCYTTEEFKKLKSQISIVREPVEHGVEI